MVIGVSTSEEELQRLKESSDQNLPPLVLDFVKKRIILPNEFFTRYQPHSLYWQELAELRRIGDSILYRNLGNNGYDGLLDFLLGKLVGGGIMTLAPEPDIGDCLINGQGIPVEYRDGNDPHGRAAFSTKTYFPRLEADAVEYARNFNTGISRISRLVQIVGRRD